MSKTNFDPKTYAGAVTATDFGFLGGKRRDPGERFQVAAGQFSDKWMEAVGGTPTAAIAAAAKQTPEPPKPDQRTAEEQADYDRGLAHGKTGAPTIPEDDAKNAHFAAGYAVGIAEAAGGGGGGGGDDKLVDIPPEWNKLHHKKRMALAKEISGIEVTTAEQANAIIKAEVDDRDAKARRGLQTGA